MVCRWIYPHDANPSIPIDKFVFASFEAFLAHSWSIHSSRWWSCSSLLSFGRLWHILHLGLSISREVCEVLCYPYPILLPVPEVDFIINRTSQGLSRASPKAPIPLQSSRHWWGRLELAVLLGDSSSCSPDLHLCRLLSRSALLSNSFNLLYRSEVSPNFNLFWLHCIPSPHQVIVIWLHDLRTLAHYLIWMIKFNSLFTTVLWCCYSRTQCTLLQLKIRYDEVILSHMSRIQTSNWLSFPSIRTFLAHSTLHCRR